MALSSEQQAKRRASQAKYRASVKRKAAAARYSASLKGKANQARYRASPKGQETKATYLSTADMQQKTADYQRAYAAAYRATPEGRALRLVNGSRSSAKLRGLEHTITVADISIPNACPVYGLKLDCGAGPKQPNVPSLDRVDNTLGYVPGNVRVISYKANLDKRDLSVEQLLALAEYVINHKAGL